MINAAMKLHNFFVEEDGDFYYNLPSNLALRDSGHDAFQ